MPKKRQEYYTVIVPAAGVGKRMGGDIPKQYLTLAGKSLIEHTLNNLINHPQINKIVLVLSAEDAYFEDTALANASWIERVTGGNERADSVLEGLKHVMRSQSTNSDWVLVHDAARPCVKHQDISNLLLLHTGHSGGILAAPVRDTMKRTFADSSSVSTVDRNGLWHALTPQFFPAKDLYQALKAGLEASLEITDEASAMEHANHPVLLVESDASNIKVTRPEDLKLAEFYLTNSL